MPGTLRLILGDQLNAAISSLRGADPARDTVLMAEVREEATYVPHHQKKIAFIFSAMRHFAAELRDAGWNVRYVKLEDKGNTGSFEAEIDRAARDVRPDQIIVTEPGEWRVREKFLACRKRLPLEIRADDRFLCSIAEFQKWAEDRKQLRMEFFYREMRRRHGVLLEKNGMPAGGAWNYDAENRKGPPKGLKFLPRRGHEPDAITQEVLELVGRRFGKNFGDLLPFDLAVTRAQALRDLDLFIRKLLPDFGKYQDDMLAGEAFLAHARLSAQLNAGLLLPLEICRRAEKAWRDDKAPLAAVEGFVRQILGWREYVRGIYWTRMPGFVEENYLEAQRPLPQFYWDAQTDMNCVAEAVTQTRRHAYSHHIQRLMVTGNFALLAGLLPSAVCEWYLLVYADAYEWVELPNVLGMALFGDGGRMASKPYAASGRYINRMSNFCGRCRFNPNETVGETACPFNSLYWDFMDRNRAKLQGNARLFNVYASWNRMTGDKREAILKQAASFLRTLDVPGSARPPTTPALKSLT